MGTNTNRTNLEEGRRGGGGGGGGGRRIREDEMKRKAYKRNLSLSCSVISMKNALLPNAFAGGERFLLFFENLVCISVDTRG